MAGATRIELSERIRGMLAEGPLSMYEVLQHLEGEDYRSVLQAWGDLRAQTALIPDERGRYRLATASSEERFH